jgi:hypothetical protein
VIRFLAGLVLGALGSASAYLLDATTYWICGVGIVLAVLVWFGELILDDLL